MDGIGGKDIKEVGGCLNSLRPIGKGDRPMIEKGSRHVTNGADDSFRLSILGRGIWARETEFDPIRRKEGVELLVIELTPVVTLKGFDRQVELSFGHLVKLDEMGEDLRFVLKGNDPEVVGEVI